MRPRADKILKEITGARLVRPKVALVHNYLLAPKLVAHSQILFNFTLRPSIAFCFGLTDHAKVATFYMIKT